MGFARQVKTAIPLHKTQAQRELIFPPGDIRQGKRLILSKPSTFRLIKQEKAWQKKNEAIAPKVGEQAPEFKLPDIHFIITFHLLPIFPLDLRRFDEHYLHG